MRGEIRIGEHFVRPDARCWIVGRKYMGTAKTDEGEEYEVEREKDVVYPGTLPQALRRVLDRMVMDNVAENGVRDLEQATATVAHLYAEIGEHIKGGE